MNTEQQRPCPQSQRKTGGFAPATPGFNALGQTGWCSTSTCTGAATGVGAGAMVTAPTSPPSGQRSGRIPAEPYPLPEWLQYNAAEMLRRTGAHPVDSLTALIMTHTITTKEASLTSVSGPETMNSLRLISHWNETRISGSLRIGIKIRFQAHFWIGKCCRPSDFVHRPSPNTF